MVSVGLYGLFFTLFLILKLLPNQTEDNFWTGTPILDRLNDGESLLNRTNFLVTLASFIFINAYAFVSFVWVVVICESHKFNLGIKFILVPAILMGSVLFALTNTWLNYGAQIFFFEILMLMGGFAGFWIGIVVISVGVVSLGLKLLIWAFWSVLYITKFTSLIPSFFTNN
jgi:hypothetical protein